MQLILTIPLTLGTKGHELDLLPVHMSNGFPSKDSKTWLKFLKAGGRRVQLSSTDANKAQAYMKQNGTEALSEDGEIAFTIAGDNLVECDPQVCNA